MCSAIERTWKPCPQLWQTKGEEGGGEAIRCIDIGGTGDWESWTSFIEDDNIEDSHMPNSDDQYVAKDRAVADVPSNDSGVSIVEHNYRVDGRGGKDLRAAKEEGDLR